MNRTATGARPPLRRFFADPDLAAGAALRVLRGAFLAFFAGHGVVAIVVAAAIALVAGVQGGPTPWVGGVVVAASLAQLLAGMAVTAVGVRAASAAARRLAGERDALARDAAAGADGAAGAEARRAFDARLRGARSSALWATVMAAVLLSTPAWFAAFAWLSGNRGAALAGSLALLALGYGFGFLQLAPLARGVRVPEPNHTAAPPEETP